MKLMQKTFALCLTACFGTPIYALADSVSYDAQSERVVYSVDTAEKTAAVIVYENQAPDNYVSIEEATGNGTVISDSFRMTDTAPSGEYTISVVTGDGQEKVISFRHINKQQGASDVALADKANTASALKTVIEQNSGDLGIDKEEFMQYADLITKYFIDIRPDKLTTTGFWNTYHQALLLSRLNGETDTETIKTAILENAAILGIDAERFSGFDDEVVKEISDRFSSGNPQKGNFSETVQEWLALAELNHAQTVNKYQQLLFTDYKDSFDLDLTDYSSSKNQEKIILKVMANRYSTIGDLEDSFKKVAKEYKAPATKPGGGGGGGGGQTSLGIIPTPTNPTSEPSQPTPSQPTEKPDTTTDEVSLSDIKGHWAEDIIKQLAASGVVSGSDGKFHPEESITRAEFCKLIAVAFYGGQTAKVDAFNDVTPDAWYYPYVSVLNKYRIIDGMESGIFAPNDLIKRQDAAVVLYRCMTELKMNTEPKREMIDFTDKTDISEYSTEAVEALYRAGVISGMPDGSFNPKASLSRAEATVMIYNVINR